MKAMVDKTRVARRALALMLCCLCIAGEGAGREGGSISGRRRVAHMEKQFERQYAEACDIEPLSDSDSEGPADHRASPSLRSPSPLSHASDEDHMPRKPVACVCSLFLRCRSSSCMRM